MACKSSYLNHETGYITCAETKLRCEGTPADKAECWRWSGQMKPQTFIREKTT